MYKVTVCGHLSITFICGFCQTCSRMTMPLCTNELHEYTVCQGWWCVRTWVACTQALSQPNWPPLGWTWPLFSRPSKFPTAEMLLYLSEYKSLKPHSKIYCVWWQGPYTFGHIMYLEVTADINLMVSAYKGIKRQLTGLNHPFRDYSRYRVASLDFRHHSFIYPPFLVYSHHNKRG